jgi:hypothetical protein
MTVVGGVVGSLITGYFTNRTAAETEARKSLAAIELEKIKFETALINRAIQSVDQTSAVKTLTFYATVGLIPTYKTEIMKVTTADKGLSVPNLPTPSDALPSSSKVNSPNSDNARIDSFSYETSPLEIEPGQREWFRQTNDKWIERYPSGKETSFVTKARLTVGGCLGTVVAPEQEENELQVFIPDRGCQTMALWFRRTTQDWIYLQRMTNIRPS